MSLPFHASDVFMTANENFFATIYKGMTSAPERTFLKYQSETMSYGEANVLSAKLANKLIQLGLVAGDRVTAQIEKSPQAVILYLACLRAGLVFHPLNTAYTVSELEFFLENAEPSLFVCSNTRLEQASALVEATSLCHGLTLEADGTGSLIEDLDTFEAHTDIAIRRKDDTALLIYTSGTTGKPKGAMITHQNIAANATSLSECWGWRSDDVLLHVLPLFHVHGLCVGLHLPLLNQSAIVFQNRFSVDETIRLLPHATVMMAVPTIYSRLLSKPHFHKKCCRTIRLLISGSAPLLPETFDQIEKRTGIRIVERYGMTEAQMITSNPLRGTPRSGTVGQALHQVEVRVRDTEGNVLAPDRVGVLEIKGPNVFKGYWKNPEATASVFREDGYFVTGDLAEIDEFGYVTIVGREKDLIISAGLNIYPKEIEIHLNRIPQVVDSAVFGVPHADLGEAVAAAVVCKSKSLTEAAIHKVLEQHLSDFKLPRSIVLVNQLPRNAMGKVEKKRLREQYRDICLSNDQG